MSDTLRCEPNRAIPIDPTFVSVSANRGEKPVQLLRVSSDAVKLEHHCGGGDGTAFTADGSIFLDPAERIIAPLVVPLAEQGDGQLDSIEKVASTPRRELAFPSPVEANKEGRCDQGEWENDE